MSDDFRHSPFLEVATGRAKGKSFVLEGETRFGIGRSDDNAIFIPSNAVSRHHAFIEAAEDGALIVVDNGSKNGIQVNNERVTEKVLEHGDQILVGDSLLVFNDPGMAIENAESQGMDMIEGDMAPPPMEAPAAGDMGMAPLSTSNVKVKIPSKRPLIYGGLAVFVGLMLYLGGDEEGGEETAAQEGSTLSAQVSTKDRFERTAKGSARIPGSKPNVAALNDPLLSEAEHAVKGFDFTDTRTIEAEQYFRRGRREYMNKKFHRAIRDFQTALSFNRKHKLSNLYLKFAVADAEKEAAQHWATGVGYYENLQYKRAIFHFSRVVDLMQHRPKEQVIRDAQKLIAVSKKRLRGAELFP